MADLTEHWSPTPLLTKLQALDHGDFHGRFDGCPCLLVRTEGTDDTFLAMLAASTRPRTLETEQPPLEPMEFRTAMATVGAVESERPPSQIEDDYRRELVQVHRLTPRAYFLVELARTEGAEGMLGRLTIGRNRNHDIVLRDASVSKLHAALRVDRQGLLTMRDMGSKNGTFLNGDAIGADWTNAYPGDVVVFGTIQATVCSPEVLYRLMHDS